MQRTGVSCCRAWPHYSNNPSNVFADPLVIHSYARASGPEFSGARRLCWRPKQTALAVLPLLLRLSISQMDVPTRQSYLMAVVQPDERLPAGGITGRPGLQGRRLAISWPGFSFPGLR